MINDDTIIDLIISIGPLCVPAEFLKTNNARKNSFIFDWCRSNIKCVIDIIKNGHEWHILNNIINNKEYDTDYEFKTLFYPHHDYIKDKDYMIRCSQRFFKVLNSEYNIIFIYMANKHDVLIKEDLNDLIEIIKEKAPNIKFKIIMAISEDIGDSINLIEDTNYYSTYSCHAPKIFWSNNMRGNDYYYKLFNTIIPFKLDIKSVKL